jgi:SanA protein
MIRKLLIATCAAVAFCLAFVLGARAIIANAAKDRTYSDVSSVPQKRVALVLGCPKRVYGGWLNPFFESRMEAAADLYRHGKAEYLIVSGDNHVRGYDEPTDMKNSLVEKGVPSDRIYLDYAGLRTLDSVVRAKEIFGQDRITVVSQRFHNERAIFLAEHHGIDAIGFDAADVPTQYAFNTLVREQFAKVKAVLDIYVLHKRPHLLGPMVMVGGAEGQQVQR